VEPYSLQTLTNFSNHHASQVPELDPQCRNARAKNKRKWLIKYQEGNPGKQYNRMLILKNASLHKV
jgi:hypothetical protein